MAAKFRLVSEFEPAGDQPLAIEKLVEGYRQGRQVQTLLGATGTGKTFTAANLIAQLNKPTLVLSHNKTLAAQLYKEFKGFFPHNAVCYFVSYYDYYQPEAYIPQRDIYIEKDSSINENLDRLRLAATSALVSREDVIIVASVSCIYGLGSPTDYKRMMVRLAKGEVIERDQLLIKLVDVQYQRNDVAFERGNFRVRGDTIEVWPAYEEFGLRIELFGDEVDALSVINPLTGEVTGTLDELFIYPGQALRDAGAPDQGCNQRHRAGIGPAAGSLQGRGQTPGGPATFRPHQVRPRHAPRGRATARESKTTPAGSPAGSRASRRTP